MTWQRIALSATTAALACVNCSRSATDSSAGSSRNPRIEHEVTLLGRRALVREDDGQILPLFDSSMPPKVALAPSTDDPSAWVVELNGKALPLVHSDVPRHGATLSFITASLSATSTTPVAAELRLRYQARQGQTTVARWPVLVARAPDRLEPLVEIRKLIAQGEYAKARSSLERSMAGFEPWIQLWAAVELARAFDFSGDKATAIQAWETSEGIASELGVVSEVVRRRMAAFFNALWVEDFSRAQSHLQRASTALAGIADAQLEGHLLYYQGLLAHRLGDYFRASQLTRAAAARLDEGGEFDMASHFRRQLAVVLGELGRHNAAWSLMVDLHPDVEKHSTSDLRVQFLSDFAWIEIQAMVAGDVPFDMAKPRRRLQHAAEAWRASSRPARRALALANLALVEFLDQHPERALTLVQQTRATNPNTQSNETRFLNLLEADIHLAQGAPARARPILDHVLSARTTATDWTWRAYYGLARVALAEGALDQAAAHFASALADRRAVAARAAIRGGEATFLADRAEVVLAATRLHLTRGDAARAFQTDEAGRAEVLRSLDTDVRRARLSEADREAFDQLVIEYLALKKAGEAQPADAEAARERFDEIFEWLDQRVPPEPEARSAPDVQAMLREGEAVVTFSRESQGFLSFWVDRQSVDVRRGTQPATVWADRLGRVQRIYAVPGDVAAARDLHAQALPDGRPLIGAVEVSYLPHAGFLARRGQAAAGSPLIVASPGAKGELTYVHTEADTVRRWLDGATVLRGPAATRSAVIAAADDRRLLHFAGHGLIRLSDPWNAHLTLAGGEQLTLEDLLVARPRIGAAVLNGCETGKVGTLSRREAVGLAEAFLVVGAQWVLASAERIRDDRALAYVKAFYEAGGARKPARAFRAVASMQVKDGRTEWRTYRLYGRPPG